MKRIENFTKTLAYTKLFFTVLLLPVRLLLLVVVEVVLLPSDRLLFLQSLLAARVALPIRRSSYLDLEIRLQGH